MSQTVRKKPAKQVEAFGPPRPRFSGPLYAEMLWRQLRQEFWQEVADAADRSLYAEIDHALEFGG